MQTRSLAVGVGLLAAGLAGAWYLRTPDTPPAAAHQAQQIKAAIPNRAPALRAADASPPTPVPQVPPSASGDRFRLVGVVAPGLPNTTTPTSGGGGFALISVDGRPAQAFRVGASVEGDTIVTALSQSGATLGSRGGGGEAISLQLAYATPAQEPSAAGRELAAVAPVARAPAAVDVPQPAPAELQNPGTRHPPLPPPAARPPMGENSMAPNDGRWVRN